MTLDDRIQQKYTEKNIRKYEEIIRTINGYYNNYAAFYKNPINVSNGINACFLEGEEAFKYYLAGYFNGPERDEYFDSLIKNVNNFSIHISKIDEYVSRLFPDISKYTVLEKMEYLKTLDSGILEKLTPDEVSYIFLHALKFSPTCKNIYDAIKPSLMNKTGHGMERIKAISEVFSEQKIKLNLHDVFVEMKDYTADLYDVVSYEFEKKVITSQFIEETNKLKKQIKDQLELGRDLNKILIEILPQAYGLVKAAVEYELGKKIYDVQLMGGIALNDGMIAEMYTGEGKTITSLLPIYLNALTGEEVDVFSPNDYLAQRDMQNNKGILNLLGLSVGCVLTSNQSFKDKQKAYNCDVVYGASSAFAFDFLIDTHQKDKTKLVQRKNKPRFVLVDEADQILINNALNPYKLSQTGLPLKEYERLENEQITNFLHSAYEIVQQLLTETRVARTNDIYEYIINGTGEIKQITQNVNDNSHVLIGPSAVSLTSLGDMAIFKYLKSDEIERLANSAKEYFVDNEYYKLGLDYTLSKEKIELTDKGLLKAVSGIKEFAELQMYLLAEPEYQTLRLYVSNALYAKYMLTKGVDYQVITNPETNQQEIVILQDGRIAENSKYTNGLHQAIELKEGLGIRLSENERLMDSALGSISNRALLARYEKRSGMTGTADPTVFSDVYGMETFKVPRNIEYQYKKGRISTPPIFRKDNPSLLYKTTEDKIKAILDDIQRSNSNGQPVLIVTNNDEEAKAIYERVTQLGLSSNLLIAGKNLEEEAKIISEAGVLGAITIATEMAGRGTDIKLGGSEDTTSVYDSVIFYEALESEFLKHKIPTCDQETLLVLISEFEQKCKADPSILQQTIEKLHKKYASDYEFKKYIDEQVAKKIVRNKEKIYQAGGLKYIQTTPFTTTRNDMQGKGRVGRQGEPGETILYSSIEELPKIGVERDLIKILSEKMGNNSCLSDSDVDGLITEIIERAQLQNEYEQDLMIASTDSIDLAMSSIGLRILKNRKDVLAADDLSVAFDNMIVSTIDSSLKDCVPTNKKKKINRNRTKLSRVKLDALYFVYMIKDVFGINISEDKISRCNTIGELKEFIYSEVKDEYDGMISGLGSERMNSKIRNIMVEQLNMAYDNFIYSADGVRLQQLNDNIAQNNSHNRIFKLNEIYDDCKKECWRNTMKSIFRPNLKQTQGEVIVSPSVPPSLDFEPEYDGYYSVEQDGIKKGERKK